MKGIKTIEQNNRVQMKFGNGEDKNMYQKHYNRNDGLSPNEKVQYNLMIFKTIQNYWNNIIKMLWEKNLNLEISYTPTFIQEWWAHYLKDKK